MRRALILVLALHATTCASTKTGPADEAQDPAGMPFIKLAKRELGLVVHWVGPSPSGATQEALERQISRRLTTTYREPLYAYARAGAFGGFDPALYLDLAEHGVDDAIVVEASADGTGRVRIISLDDEKTVLDAPLSPAGDLTDGPGGVERFADRVWLVVAKNWTDPAAGPPLNRARVADRLAERGACTEAMHLYDLLRTHQKQPRSVAEARLLDRSTAHMMKCKEEIALKEAIEKDRTAVFGLTLSASGLAPDIQAVLKKAMAAPGVRTTLEALTNKPVLIEATPESITLVLRFHPDRYQRWIARYPKYVLNQRALYLEDFVPAMSTLAQIRDTAADALPPYDAPMVKKLATAIRLFKLPDDRVEIDFAELDGRILFTDTLRVKVGARPEAQVPTEAKGLLRDHVFVIGPPREVSGEITNYGLVYKFFELE